MIRLFIALLIPEEIKEIIINNCFEAGGGLTNFKLEAKEKIHLTLKFIGDVNNDLLTDIINEIYFVQDYSSFNCAISKFGFFFRDKEAKILWGNLETDESIVPLVDDLNVRLSKYGIEVERRKFKGHLTLMRIKNRIDDQFIKRIKDFKFSPIHFNVNQVALIQSYLKPSGSEYKVLKIYELK